MSQICDLIKAGDCEGLGRELGVTEGEEGGVRGNGCDLTCNNCHGRTPLELACVLGKPQVVQLLLGAGAPSNQVSSSGYTSLHLACAWNQLDCVKELVIGGADHHLLTCYKDTAHQIALRYGHSACADYLECVEARAVLVRAVQESRNTVSDADKIAGRWNKEDKSKVSTLCSEKAEWLDKHLDCSLEEVRAQTEDFHSRLQPLTNKLQPQ